MSDFFRQLELAYPTNLWSLVVLGLLVLISLLGKRPSLIALGLRLLACGLLILAFAGLTHRGPTSQRHTVFIKDTSASLFPRAREVADQFVSRAEAALRAGSQNESSTISFPAPKANGEPDLTSDPAAALLLAAASVPPERVPQLVLLTDGNQTQGDLLSAAQGVAMPVFVAPLAPFEAEVGIVAFEAPPQAAPGEPITLRATAVASHDMPGEWRIFAADQELDRRPVQLKAGENQLVFPTVMPPQETSFRVSLSPRDDAPANDTLKENNERRLIVTARSPPRVLQVGGTASLGELLRRQGFAVSAGGSLPDSPAGYQTFDAVVLVNPAPQSVPAARAALLESFVQQGGGLIVIGGDNTFSKAAGYSGSDLERLLPISCFEGLQERARVLALVLVIDRSKSMEEERRIDLAKDAAKRTVNILAPTDKCGVIAFGDDTEWVSDIVSCTKKAEIVTRINSLKAQGLTNMFPALERAHLALEVTEADRRHVILLSDGVPYPADFKKLATAMAAAGITVSTVSVGKGADQALLHDIAVMAGGKHNHCDDPREVPKILEEETKRATAAPQVQEFRPKELRRLPELDTSALPTLVGHTTALPKPNSEMVLQTPDVEPVLSWWRYGAGMSVACVADVTRDWANWPGNGRFWNQLVRHASRRSFADARVSTRLVGSELEITLDAAADSGDFWNSASVAVEVVSPDATTARSVPLSQSAPGRYAIRLPATLPGVYQLRLRAEDGQGKEFTEARSVVVDYPGELLVRPTQEELLRAVARVSGGEYNPSPESLAAPSNRTVDRVRPLSSFLVMGAIGLFLLEMLWRRRCV